MTDLVSIIYSFSEAVSEFSLSPSEHAPRMYGLRRAKRKTEKITQELKNEAS